MDALISFRVPQEIKDRVERLAARSLISSSDVSRMAVLEKLEREEITAAEPVETQPATTEAAS